MDSKYRSEFLGSLHETAAGLHKIGIINDAEMQEYDHDCLAQEDKTNPIVGISQNKPVTPVFTSHRH
jgi:DNA-binding transcriptional regulator YiaG